MIIKVNKKIEAIKSDKELQLPEDLRKEIEKFSHCASMDEIEENDFNLNIPRYVDTFEEEEPIDLDEVCDELEKIAKEMEEVDREIKKYCDELGIRAPIF